MTTAGYDALTETLALLEEPRVLFRVRGDRARRVVNGLVTNTLDGLESGIGRYALVLTAKGRPISDLRILPPAGFEENVEDGGSEALWLDAPLAGRDGLRDLFARTVPPIFATVSELEVRRLSLVGPSAADASPFEACGVSLDPERATWASREPLRAMTVAIGTAPGGTAGLLVSRESIESGGWDLYVPADRAEPLWSCLEERIRAAGGATASVSDWETVRVERGLPTLGAEITAENLPQETGQTDRAISFDKGCYTGQEVVARIHYRGHVNRLLRGVRAIGEAIEPLRSGETLSRDRRDVGRVVTAVESPRLGSIGLAYVRREVEPGEHVARSGTNGEAVIVELPFTES